MHQICAFIRTTGLSDAAAAAAAQVPRSTLSRWKLEDEEVEMQLTHARTQFLLPRLEKIGQTVRPDGQLDWRALAWLVKWASQPEKQERVSEQRLRRVELAEATADAELGTTMERVRAAQARHAEEVEICPEIQTQGDFAYESNESERMGGGGQEAVICPEIRAADGPGGELANGWSESKRMGKEAAVAGGGVGPERGAEVRETGASADGFAVCPEIQRTSAGGSVERALGVAPGRAVARGGAGRRLP